MPDGKPAGRPGRRAGRRTVMSALVTQPAARRAAVLGCDGKWAIHPSQVALANEVFTPSEKEVARARRILEAMEQAKREGRGAVALDGRLLDIASIRQAAALVEMAEAVASRG